MNGWATVRRYWIDLAPVEDTQTIEISGDTFHHIFDVCRETVGSRIEILTGGKTSFVTEVIAKSKKSASVKIIELKNLPQPPLPRINLNISMPKISTFETILEKAVELGVQKIQPFSSDFSHIKKKETIPLDKLNRWNRIVKSACEQSYRSELLDIAPLIPFSECLAATSPKNFKLFAYEGGGAPLLETLESQNLKNFETIDIFVGSEGGFSKPEVEFVMRSGIKVVSLGSQILRVETACISLLSILKYSSGHLA